jgi:hypothetical protein
MQSFNRAIEKTLLEPRSYVVMGVLGGIVGMSYWPSMVVYKNLKTCPMLSWDDSFAIYFHNVISSCTHGMAFGVFYPITILSACNISIVRMLSSYEERNKNEIENKVD